MVSPDEAEGQEFVRRGILDASELAGFLHAARTRRMPLRELLRQSGRLSGSGVASSPASSASSARRDGSGERIGPYLLGRELGRGGMGVVFEGEHASLGRRAAVKILLGSDGEVEAQQRFELEARAMARLTHPNIAAIYDYGIDHGRPWLAMELIQGGLLDTVLKERGRLDWREALELVGPLLEALAVAHASQILHRDLKPGNILLRRDGTPVITDFGLARLLDESGLSRTGDVMGTPAYMSPEQIQGLPSIDERSDLFSIGVILYELITGKRPFSGKSPRAIAMAILSADPPPPSKLAPAVPAALDELVLKLLAREPEDRPSSARTVIARLATALSEPDSTDSPAGTSAGPRRSLFALGVVTVALIFTALALGLQLHEARQTVAELQRDRQSLESELETTRQASLARQSDIQRQLEAERARADAHASSITRHLARLREHATTLRSQIRPLLSLDNQFPKSRDLLDKELYELLGAGLETDPLGVRLLAIREQAQMLRDQTPLRSEPGVHRAGLERLLKQAESIEPSSDAERLEQLLTITAIVQESANLAANSGQADEARALDRRLLGLYDQIDRLESRPGLRSFYRALGSQQRAELARVAERWEEAIKHTRVCVSLCREAMKERPEDVRLWSALSEALGSLAGLLLTAGKDKEAIETLLARVELESRALEAGQRHAYRAKRLADQLFSERRLHSPARLPLAMPLLKTTMHFLNRQPDEPAGTRAKLLAADLALSYSESLRALDMQTAALELIDPSIETLSKVRVPFWNANLRLVLAQLFHLRGEVLLELDQHSPREANYQYSEELFHSLAPMPGTHSRFVSQCINRLALAEVQLEKGGPDDRREARENLHWVAQVVARLTDRDSSTQDRVLLRLRLRILQQRVKTDQSDAGKVWRELVGSFTRLPEDARPLFWRCILEVGLGLAETAHFQFEGAADSSEMEVATSFVREALTKLPRPRIPESLKLRATHLWLRILALPTLTPTQLAEQQQLLRGWIEAGLAGNRRPAQWKALARQLEDRQRKDQQPEPGAEAATDPAPDGSD